jgi:hypothetical protein
MVAQLARTSGRKREWVRCSPLVCLAGLSPRLPLYLHFTRVRVGLFQSRINEVPFVLKLRKPSLFLLGGIGTILILVFLGGWPARVLDA